MKTKMKRGASGVSRMVPWQVTNDKAFDFFVETMINRYCEQTDADLSEA